MLRGVFLGRLTHGEEDKLVDVDVRLQTLVEILGVGRGCYLGSVDLDTM